LESLVAAGAGITKVIFV
ncbi:hypothetical protein CMV_025123, partial [Castanea mollissima]